MIKTPLNKGFQHNNVILLKDYHNKLSISRRFHEIMVIFSLDQQNSTILDFISLQILRKQQKKDSKGSPALKDNGNQAA